MDTRQETERYRQQARQLDDEYEECRGRVAQQQATIARLKLALEQAKYVLSMAGLNVTADDMGVALSSIPAIEEP